MFESPSRLESGFVRFGARGTDPLGVVSTQHGAPLEMWVDPLSWGPSVRLLIPHLTRKIQVSYSVKETREKREEKG